MGGPKYRHIPKKNLGIPAPKKDKTPQGPLPAQGEDKKIIESYMKAIRQKLQDERSLHKAAQIIRDMLKKK